MICIPLIDVQVYQVEILTQGCQGSCQVNRFSSRSRYMAVERKDVRQLTAPLLRTTVYPLYEMAYGSMECIRERRVRRIRGDIKNIVSGLRRQQECEGIMDYISSNLHSWMSANPLTQCALCLRSCRENLISLLPHRQAAHVSTLNWIEISYLCSFVAHSASTTASCRHTWLWFECSCRGLRDVNKS